MYGVLYVHIKYTCKDKEQESHAVGFHCSQQDTQANLIAGTVNVLRFFPWLLRGEDGRRGPTTWLVLVGMTDQASSNHIRPWRSGRLLARPLLYIHNCRSCCLLSPSERVKAVSGASLVLLSSREGCAGFDPSLLITEVHSQLRHISVLLVWR